jgi:hypothetical protein
MQECLKIYLYPFLFSSLFIHLHFLASKDVHHYMIGVMIHEQIQRFNKSIKWV